MQFDRYRTESGSDRMRAFKLAAIDYWFRVFKVELSARSLSFGLPVPADSLRVLIFVAGAQLTVRIKWSHRRASLVIAH